MSLFIMFVAVAFGAYADYFLDCALYKDEKLKSKNRKRIGEDNEKINGFSDNSSDSD